MALKFKIALCLATLTGLFTAFLSFMYGVRVINVFYRGAFTTVLFFALVYIISIFAESYLKKLLENDAHKGKKIDITDEPDSGVLPVSEWGLEKNTADEAAAGTEFKPLNPDDFMSFSPTQK